MSTRNTAEHGVELTLREIRQRGATADRVPGSRRNEVMVRRSDGALLTLRIKTRTGGTWQGTTNDADPDPERAPARFVVFVDLADAALEFYVAPEWWFQLDVHRDHSAYLARRPGPRASTHHAIQLRRIAEWRGRWDLLDLDRKD
jgi:hypothetical protein